MSMQSDIDKSRQALNAPVFNAEGFQFKLNYPGKELDDIRRGEFYLPSLCQIAAAIISAKSKDMSKEEISQKAYEVLIQLRNTLRENAKKGDI